MLARVARDHRRSPRSSRMKHRADQRQEGDERQDAASRSSPATAHRMNRYQVISSTTPISMAKA